MATISLNSIETGGKDCVAETRDIEYNAPIKWAQKSDGVILLTIDLHDVTDESIELTDKTLTFHGKSEGKTYSCDLNFYKPINSEESTWQIHARSIQFHLKKRSEKIAGSGNCGGSRKGKVSSVDFVEAWPRLLSNKAMEKNKYDISVDWSHYEDSD